MAKSRDRVVKKFKDRIAASGAEYDAGIKQPRASWQAQYKMSSERMKAALLESLEKNKHIKGVEAVGDAGWAEAALKKGSARFTAAASIAADNYGKVVDQVLAAGDAAAAAANALPNTTFQQRVQRSVAAMNATHEFWGKGR